jgi:hypothetical protein
MTLGDPSSSDPVSAPASPHPVSLLSSLPNTPLSSDTSHPSIPLQSVKESSWGDVAILDKNANNYAAWSRHVVRILQLSSGLDQYLDGSLPAPDPHYEPRAHHNWKLNNAAIQAFLFLKCASSEHQFIEDCTTAEKIWNTLKTRHIHQGPMTQVTLIQEALSVRYSSSVPFAETSLILQNLNRRIWDMGTPTSEGFLCILMLLALSADDSLSPVRDSIVTGLSSATVDHAYMSAHIVDRLDYEQQARSMAIARTVLVPAEAHIARGSCALDSNSKSICSNCKKPRHTSEFLHSTWWRDGRQNYC